MKGVSFVHNSGICKYAAFCIFSLIVNCRYFHLFIIVVNFMIFEKHTIISLVFEHFSELVTTLW